MTRNGSCAGHAPGRSPRMFGWHFLLPMAITACSLFLRQTAHAQDPKPTEYEVEAAYLSNFGRFVEWPAKAGAANEPFNVCVLGQDPFGPLLDVALRGETIGGALMAAKRISGLDEAPACRIVFVSATKDAQLPAILTTMGTSSVLTVSDMPGFTKRGGMIQFVLDGNRVRFEINLGAAQRAGLALSAQLLKLATAVRRTP